MNQSIEEIARHKLPFLQSPEDDTALQLEIVQSFYALQPYLNKTDVEVEDETAYSGLQKMLIAYYTAYQLVNRKGLKVLQAGSDSEDGSLPIKKVKADVVETEFDTDKKNRLWFSAEVLRDELKLLVCQTAKTLNIRLPMCHTKLKTVFLPLKVYH